MPKKITSVTDVNNYSKAFLNDVIKDMQDI